MLSHHHGKFGGHRYCGSRDKMILGCHMISQHRVIRESCNFSYHSTKFCGRRHRDSEDIMILVCHMILQDQTVIWLYGQKSIKVNYHLS